MSKRLLRSDKDLRRTAEHREIARAIVSKDRSHRKLGLTVDTAGAIARAIDRAYRQGLADGQMGTPAQEKPEAPALDEAIEWVLLPPRPRAAFWNICLFVLGSGDGHGHPGYLVKAPTERGTPGWRLVMPDWEKDDKVIGAASIAPLVSRGLLVADTDQPDRLIVSDLGRSTWAAFCQRGGRFPDDLTKLCSSPPAL